MQSISSVGGSSHRLSKNRPLEISSKRPSRNTHVAQTNSFRSRDPRFDTRCGQYDPELFSSSYSFINDLKQREIQKLRKALKRIRRSERIAQADFCDESEEPMLDSRDPLFEQLSGEEADEDADEDEDDDELSVSTSVARTQRLHASRARIEDALRRLENQRRSAQDLQRTRSLKREIEARERDEVALGKRPFFQTKSAFKHLLLADKFKRLKESGRLAKYMQKLQRRRTQRDRRRDAVPDTPPARRTERH